MDTLNPVVINKLNVEFIKVLFRRVADINGKVAREHGEILRITSTYGIIKIKLLPFQKKPESPPTSCMSN